MCAGCGDAEFVGSGRHELVAKLHMACVAVREPGSRPQLFTIEAPTGWGKTRVVQALYGRLAADQGSPRYWPPSIRGFAPGGRNAIEQAHGLRKLVFPTVAEPELKSVPEYFWWGLTATRRQAGLLEVQALAEDLTQFQVHRPGLERRFNLIAGVGDRTRRAVRRNSAGAAREVASASTAEVIGATLGVAGMAGAGPAGAVLGIAAGVTIGATVDLATERLIRLIGRLRGRDTAPAALKLDALGSERDDLVGPIATELSELARAGVPLFIAVEDIHSADPSLVELLVRLLSGPPAPIVVVATSWPGLLDEVSRPAHRLFSDVPTSTITRMTVATLTELDQDERTLLAARLLGKPVDRDARLLGKHFTNPLALELASHLPRIRRAIAAGSLDVDLDFLPRDVEGIYRVMWDELSPSLQRALTLAVLSSPDGVPANGRRPLVPGSAWDPAVVVAAAAVTPWLVEDAERLQERLDAEPVAYGWARTVDDWLRTWLEPAQREIAAGDRERLCSDEELREYYSHLAHRIDISAVAPTSRRVAGAQLLVTLAHEGFIEWTEHALTAAEIVVAELHLQDDRGSLRQLVAVTNALPKELQGGSPFLRLRRALALGKLGEYAPALAELSALLGEDALRQHDELWWIVRVAHANLVGESGDVSGAIAGFRATIYADAAGQCTDFGYIRLARGLLVEWLGIANDLDAATAELRQLIEDTPHSEAQSRETFATRRRLAALLERTGDKTGAIELLRVILEDQERLFGSEDRAALETRWAYVKATMVSNDTDELLKSLEQFEDVLVRVLGSDDEFTLDVRFDRLACLAQSGDLVAAVESLLTLSEDYERILGANHASSWMTLELLKLLAAELRKSNFSGEHDDVVARCERALDEKHSSGAPPSVPKSLLERTTPRGD